MRYLQIHHKAYAPKRAEFALNSQKLNTTTLQINFSLNLQKFTKFKLKFGVKFEFTKVKRCEIPKK